ncbi:MAG: hypothetical protein ACFFKA_00255 [Candidatus Thorarchaeota archaeon]
MSIAFLFFLLARLDIYLSIYSERVEKGRKGVLPVQVIRAREHGIGPLLFCSWIYFYKNVNYIIFIIIFTYNLKQNNMKTLNLKDIAFVTGVVLIIGMIIFNVVVNGITETAAFEF